ncbi:MAG: CpsD/CapB family tyrosine-protein kinase [Desulfobacterales bacterium]|nr:CpsD/CapB family tyrosine-protein kinase [Desulfobacterales bacterium]
MGKTREALMRAEKEFQAKGLHSFQENKALYENDLLLPKEIPSENYQEIKTKLNIRFPDKSVKTILVTGGDRKNGTSTNAIGLAKIFSRDNQNKVLLIDANMRSPILHKVFNIENKNGLSSLSENGNRKISLLNQVGNSSLYIVPVGKMIPVTMELFESSSFDTFLTKMKNDFDYIIIDSPPVNGCAETLMIAKMADGIILVLESEKSRQHVATKAKQLIDESGVLFIGVIINRRKYYIPKWIYKRL